jgi:hypothetical protein
MDAYLAKPVRPDELFDLIDRHAGVPNVRPAGAAQSQPTG